MSSEAAPKRAHSASPPPSIAPPVPSTSSATSPAAKRVKLDTGAEEAAPAAAEPAVAPTAPAAGADVKAAGQQKRNEANKNRNANKKGGKKHKGKPPKPGGVEEAGAFDVLELLGEARVKELEALERDWKKESEVEWGAGADGKEVEVRVVAMNAHGDGLALLTPASESAPTRLISVPFALPTELVIVKVCRHEPDFLMSHGDLVRIVEPSERRNATPEELPGQGEPSEELKAVRAQFGNRVQCKYYGTCSGCQYQPLSYDDQLEIKRNVVRKAFANFSRLDASLIPAIGPTLPSPLQYGYRTKLTPHFQAPPSHGKSGGRRNQWKGKGKGVEPPAVAEEDEKPWEVTIGFEQKGRKRIIDIEECVIATKVINDAMVHEREKVKTNIASFKRGATILLRDSLPPRAEGVVKSLTAEPSTEAHVCITDHHATVREQVGTVEFEQIAGSFFQNNSSILPPLMDYIAHAVRPADAGPRDPTVKSYLVDAYCGSGLFALSLADQFDHIEGVEIDKTSIKFAKKNAEWNKGPGRGEVGFRAGMAEDIFGDITFPSDQTTILIDPPRKGCDDLFMTQLLKFNPATIIYVSCNVHTQARDIGWLIRESSKKVEQEGTGKKGYWIESVRAADLFANTHHAEGVAVLRREL